MMNEKIIITLVSIMKKEDIEDSLITISAKEFELVIIMNDNNGDEDIEEDDDSMNCYRISFSSSRNPCLGLDIPVQSYFSCRIMRYEEEDLRLSIPRLFKESIMDLIHARHASIPIIKSQTKFSSKFKDETILFIKIDIFLRKFE